MVLAVEKPSFLVDQLLEPHFRQLFCVDKYKKYIGKHFNFSFLALKVVEITPLYGTQIDTLTTFGIIYV